MNENTVRDLIEENDKLREEIERLKASIEKCKGAVKILEELKTWIKNG